MMTAACRAGTGPRSPCRFVILLAAAICGLAAQAAAAESPPAGGSLERVGRQEDGRTVLPVNQVITPLGTQVELPGLRPQTLALSPDGRLLAVSGKTAEVLILDPASGAVRQRVAIRAGNGTSTPGAVIANLIEPRAKGQVSFTGLIFTPDGTRLLLSNVDGDLKVFDVAPDGSVSVTHSLRGRTAEPAGDSATKSSATPRPPVHRAAVRRGNAATASSSSATASVARPQRSSALFRWRAR